MSASSTRAAESTGRPARPGSAFLNSVRGRGSVRGSDKQGSRSNIAGVFKRMNSAGSPRRTERKVTQARPSSSLQRRSTHVEQDLDAQTKAARGQVRQNANTFWKKLVGDGTVYDQSFIETANAVYELFAKYFTARRHSRMALLFPICQIFCVLPLVDGKGGDDVAAVATLSVVVQFVMWGSLLGFTHMRDVSLENYSPWFLGCLAVQAAIILVLSSLELKHGGHELEAAMSGVGSFRLLALFTFATGMELLPPNHIVAAAVAPTAIFMIALIICQVSMADEMDRDSAKRRFDLLLQECIPFIAGAIPMCYTVPVFFDRYYQLTSEVVSENASVALKCQMTTKLLFSVLPEEVVPEFIERSLRSNNDSEIIENFEETTILFLKVIGLGQLSNRLSTYEIVSLFHELVCRFDELTVLHQVEKIRTDFGVYLLASGLPTRSERHAIKMANMAVSLIKAIAKFSSDMELGGGEELQCKIGLSSGSVVAGVIGTSRYQYDLVGDTVNIAARMCSSCASGKIQVTESTELILRNEQKLHFISLGIKNIKGKGEMHVYQMTTKEDMLAQSSLRRSTTGLNQDKFHSYKERMATEGIVGSGIGAGAAGGEAAVVSRSPLNLPREGQIRFREGDKVRVNKPGGSTHGKEAVVLDPDVREGANSRWTGRVQVRLMQPHGGEVQMTEQHGGATTSLKQSATKSYKQEELEMVMTFDDSSQASSSASGVAAKLGAVAGAPRDFGKMSPPPLPKLPPPKNSPCSLPPLSLMTNGVPSAIGPPAGLAEAAGEEILQRAREAAANTERDTRLVAKKGEAATQRAQEVLAKGTKDTPTLQADREEQSTQKDAVEPKDGTFKNVARRSASPRQSTRTLKKSPRQSTRDLKKAALNARTGSRTVSASVERPKFGSVELANKRPRGGSRRSSLETDAGDGRTNSMSKRIMSMRLADDADVLEAAKSDGNEAKEAMARKMQSTRKEQSINLVKELIAGKLDITDSQQGVSFHRACTDELNQLLLRVCPMLLVIYCFAVKFSANSLLCERQPYPIQLATSEAIHQLLLIPSALIAFAIVAFSQRSADQDDLDDNASAMKRISGAGKATAAAEPPSTDGGDVGPELNADHEEQTAGYYPADYVPIAVVEGSPESHPMGGMDLPEDGLTLSDCEDAEVMEFEEEEENFTYRDEIGTRVRKALGQNRRWSLSLGSVYTNPSELPLSSPLSSPSSTSSAPRYLASCDEHAPPALEAEREEVEAAVETEGEEIVQEFIANDDEPSAVKSLGWAALKVLPLLIFAVGITMMAYKVRLYATMVVWLIYVVSCYSFFAFEGFDYFEALHITFVFGLSGLLAFTQWVAETQRDIDFDAQYSSSNTTIWGQHPYQLREIDRCVAAESGSVSTRWLGGARESRGGGLNVDGVGPGLLSWEEREDAWLGAFVLQQLLPVVGMSLLTWYMLTNRIAEVYRVFKREELKKFGMVYENEAMDGILAKCIPEIVLNSMRLGNLPTISGLGTIMFADLVSFTPFSAKLTPLQLAQFLNEMYFEFDKLAERHGVEKIKTVGDCYIACAGVLTNVAEHADVMCGMGCGIQQAIKDLNVKYKYVTDQTGIKIAMRAGIHTGKFVGGVIGREKFGLDLWGNTVTIAQKMEECGVTDRVSVSQDTYAEAIRSKRFNFEWVKDVELFEEEWESYWGGVPTIDAQQVLDEWNSAVYRKTRLVYAFKSSDAFSFVKKDWGNYVDKKDEGSWLIVNLPPGGSGSVKEGQLPDQLADMYGIEHKEFAANYEVDSGQGNAHQYGKKEPVRAARAACTFTLQPDKNGKEKVVHAGDFLVQKIKGDDQDEEPCLSDAYVITSQEFKDLYLVHDEDPAARRLGIPPTRSSKMQMYLISTADTNNPVLGRTDEAAAAAAEEGASYQGKVVALQTGAKNVSSLKEKLAGLKNGKAAAVPGVSPKTTSLAGNRSRRGRKKKGDAGKDADGKDRQRAPSVMSSIMGGISERRRSSVLKREQAATAMAEALTGNDGTAQAGGSAGAGTQVKKNAVKPTNVAA